CLTMVPTQSRIMLRVLTVIGLFGGYFSLSLKNTGGGPTFMRHSSISPVRSRVIAPFRQAKQILQVAGYLEHDAGKGTPAIQIAMVGGSVAPTRPPWRSVSTGSTG